MNSDNIGKAGNVTADNILSQLAAIAKADISDYVEIIDGNAVLKPLDKLPPRKRAAVAYVKNAAGSKGAEIKLYDKMHALELLGKYLGMFDGSADSEKETLAKLDRLLDKLCGAPFEKR